MLSEGSDCISLRQIVRLFTFAGISERNFLFLRDLIKHLLIIMANVYFCLNQHIKKTA